jgi:hypothetical protein
MAATDGTKREFRGLFPALAVIFAGAPPSALEEFADRVRPAASFF